LRTVRFILSAQSVDATLALKLVRLGFRSPNGIAEDIITAFSKLRWFFVIARNSSFSYRGKSVELNQVAHELGVRYVLEGSVRKRGDQVRITAQLIDALTGNHIWADHYDGELRDVFTLQDEITRKVVAAIVAAWCSIPSVAAGPS
jgi:TolB-like protein